MSHRTVIRPATAADMPVCQRIYAHHVAHSTATFDEVAPAPDLLNEKRAFLQAKGFPFLVAVEDPHVVGYAYAAPFRDRSAYRFTAEESIYLHPDHTGRGIAGRLLADLIVATRALGLKSLIAVIGLEQDQPLASSPSVKAHTKAGFVPVGTLNHVGYKFQRWLKTAYMQLDLEADRKGSEESPKNVVPPAP